jgi:uncharacterized membrane protein
VTLYDILLFGHIAAAIVWLGGAVSVQLLALRAERTGEAGALARAVTDLEWLTLRVFVPSSWLALSLGVGLVLDGPWRFSDVWIVVGLSGYGASVVLGMLFVNAQLAVIAALRVRVDADADTDSESLVAATRRLFFLARLELALLLVVVLDMSLKPAVLEDSLPLAAGSVLAFGLVMWLHAMGRPRSEDVPEAVPGFAD